MAPSRFAILAVVALALAGLAFWRHQVADDAQLTAQHLADGTAAMKQLNAADAAFPATFQASMSGLTGSLLLNPTAAAKTLRDSIVPDLDRYVATLDRAVAAADLVLADSPDAETQRSVDKIRKRGRAMRTARTRLADLGTKLAGGMTADAASNELMSLSMAMMIDP